MGKFAGHILGVKRHESEQDVLKRFNDILQSQDYDLINKIKIFINGISYDKSVVKSCFSIVLPSESVFLIFSRYAENDDDFGWIIGKMEWCGGNDFVWQQLSFLNNLNSSFFHDLSVMKNFACVAFMFGVVCKYAPTPRDLRDFLLLKNKSNESILTCISYSSVLSSQEKILFLRLFVNKFREIFVKIYSERAGAEAELILFTEFNEALLFEVVNNALAVGKEFGQLIDWLPPFVKELVRLVHDCSGDKSVAAVNDFVNKVKVSDKGVSLTALDLLLVHGDLPTAQMGIIRDLIDFLSSVGARRFQDL